jgi:hypothetical protein
MHPIQWVQCHLDQLQAWSSIAIAFLTFALIVLTGIYATANWRTMKLLEKDLRYRSHPIIEGFINVDPKIYGVDEIKFEGVVKATHAPVLILSAKASFVFSDNTSLASAELGPGGPVPLGLDSKAHLASTVRHNQLPDDWSLLVRYSDLAGEREYEAKFSDKPPMYTLLTIKESKS